MGVFLNGLPVIPTAHSAASWEMAAHPLVSEICDAILSRQIVTMDRHSMQEQLVVRFQANFRSFVSFPRSFWGSFSMGNDSAPIASLSPSIHVTTHAIYP